MRVFDLTGVRKEIKEYRRAMVRRSGALRTALATLLAAAAACNGSSPPDGDRREPVEPAPYQVVGESSSESYALRRLTFRQPVDSSSPEGEVFDQRVVVLRPTGAPDDAPVLFNLLGEAYALSDQEVIGSWDFYGQPADVIFVTAEHRGYGASLSPDADQSVPRYLDHGEAARDSARIAAALASDYTGSWIVYGASYAGSLALETAASFRSPIDAVLASSTPQRWTAALPTFEAAIHAALGDPTYGLMVEHIGNLTPAEPFDDTWIEREFLMVALIGITQYVAYSPLVAIIQDRAGDSTEDLLQLIHQLDNGVAGGTAMRYARGRAKQTLTRQEAESGEYTWRQFRWQECTQVGAMYTSGQANALLGRSLDDYRHECELLFGAENLPAWDDAFPPWDLTDTIQSLRADGIPVLFVIGQLDPWSALGPAIPEGDRVERETWSEITTDGTTYFVVPEGRHAPDYDDQPLARATLDSAIAAVR